MTGWLITGAGGMLGRDLAARLKAEGEPGVIECGRADLDITDPVAAAAALDRHRPGVVVNCAAWTAVDDAEDREEAALAVNGHAVGHLAAACAGSGAALVQVSTDYVFDGTARSPYSEDQPPSPRSAYGRTKLAGERAARTAPGTVYIVRTAWLYGAHGRNFVATMLARARAGQASSVVDDQRGQPTWTADVADRIHALIASGAPAGTYHATSSGETTWYGLAREVYARAGADPALVTPTTTGAFPRPAPRPAYSVLGHDAWAAAGLEPVGDWRDALDRAFPALAG